MHTMINLDVTSIQEASDPVLGLRVLNVHKVEDLPYSYGGYVVDHQNSGRILSGVALDYGIELVEDVGSGVTLGEEVEFPPESEIYYRG